jgi:hypothetical protein
MYTSHVDSSPSGFSLSLVSHVVGVRRFNVGFPIFPVNDLSRELPGHGYSHIIDIVPQLEKLSVVHSVEDLV